MALLMVLRGTISKKIEYIQALTHPIDNLVGIINELRRISVHQVPSGFKYISQREIPSTDSRSGGFEAQYQSSEGEVTVLFLVLNLHQEHQRSAAILAAANSPRRSSGKKGKRDARDG